MCNAEIHLLILPFQKSAKREQEDCQNTKGRNPAGFRPFCCCFFCCGNQETALPSWMPVKPRIGSPLLKV